MEPGSSVAASINSFPSFSLVLSNLITTGCDTTSPAEKPPFPLQYVKIATTTRGGCNYNYNYCNGTDTREAALSQISTILDKLETTATITSTSIGVVVVVGLVQDSGSSSSSLQQVPTPNLPP